MFCGKCGQPIVEGNLFCVYCGTKVEQSSPQVAPQVQPVTPQITQPVTPQVTQPVTPQVTHPVTPQVTTQVTQQVTQPVTPREAQSAIPNAVPMEMKQRERKKISPKPFIISGVVVVLGIIIGVFIYKNIKDARKGYENVEDAIEADAELINDENWEAIIAMVTSEEWEVIFNEYEVGLKDEGINNIDELKEAVLKNADESYLEGIDELSPEDGIEELEYLENYDYLNDEYIAEYYKNMGFQLYYYEVPCTYEEEVDWDHSEDQEFTEMMVYYRAGYSREHYSTIGVALALDVTEDLISGGKAADAESAMGIGEAMSSALAYEDAYEEVVVYPYGTIIATADGGEPFEQAVDGSLDVFMEELNNGMEFIFDDEDSPEIEYHGSSIPWNPAGWAVALDESGKVTVYITDGTTENMLELYPDLADEYR